MTNEIPISAQGVLTSFCQWKHAKIVNSFTFTKPVGPENQCGVSFILT